MEHIFVKYCNYAASSYLHLCVYVEWFKKQTLNLTEQQESRKCLWKIMPKDDKTTREKNGDNLFP